MSRSQQTQVFNTAQGQESTDAGDAQKALQETEGDIGDYKSQLAKFAADNPYVQGGEFQTATNQELTNTADATAQAAKNQLQSQAERTGQNPAAANAAAEEIARQSQRTLSSDEAEATKQRIAGEEGHNKATLSASEVPAELESGLYKTAGGLTEEDLQNMENAAKGNQSFGDVFGQSFGSALGAGLSKLATGGN